MSLPGKAVVMDGHQNGTWFFPGSPPTAFGCLGAFFDILSVLQMLRFEITSFLVCVGLQSFLLFFPASLLEILHPQRIPESDIIHLVSGTLKSHELPCLTSFHL